MRHPGLLISLILCFSSGLNFGLASDVGFGHIACPPIGKNLDSTNLASNQIWVSLLFNTAKNTGEGSGFVESDGSIGNQILECFGTAGHCLLIRIALPIEKICNGLHYPKQVKVRLIDNFTRHLIRSNDLLGTPNQYKISAHTTSEFRPGIQQSTYSIPSSKISSGRFGFARPLLTTVCHFGIILRSPLLTVEQTHRTKNFLAKYFRCYVSKVIINALSKMKDFVPMPTMAIRLWTLNTLIPSLIPAPCDPALALSLRSTATTIPPLLTITTVVVEWDWIEERLTRIATPRRSAL
jgi:hypothetical protein